MPNAKSAMHGATVTYLYHATKGPDGKWQLDQVTADAGLRPLIRTNLSPTDLTDPVLWRSRSLSAWVMDVLGSTSPATGTGTPKPRRRSRPSSSASRG